jgi:capsid protein
MVLEATVFASVKEMTAGDMKEQSRNLAENLYDENGRRVNGLQRENVADMGSGNVFSYGKGGGPMEFSTPKTPANNFDSMQMAFIDIVGMAMDVPPEVILSKYSTSYTAHKGAFNDFIKLYMFDRQSFNDNVNYYVILELAKYFFLNGIIEPLHPAFFTNAIIQRAVLSGFWMGPVPGHINPNQEVSALISARDNALITPADATYTYGQGGEFEDFIEEWGQQMKEWKDKSPEEKVETVIGEQEEIDSMTDDDNENGDDDQNNGGQE